MSGGKGIKESMVKMDGFDLSLLISASFAAYFCVWGKMNVVDIRIFAFRNVSVVLHPRDCPASALLEALSLAVLNVPSPNHVRIVAFPNRFHPAPKR